MYYNNPIMMKEQHSQAKTAMLGQKMEKHNVFKYGLYL